MKDKKVEQFGINRHIIFCSCGDLNHQLVFEKDKDHPEIDIYLTYPIYKNILDRIKAAFKYIFMKKQIYISNDILIDEQNISEFEEWIEDLKNSKQNSDIKENVKFCWKCGEENLTTNYQFECWSCESKNIIDDIKGNNSERNFSDCIKEQTQQTIEIYEKLNNKEK